MLELFNLHIQTKKKYLKSTGVFWGSLPGQIWKYILKSIKNQGIVLELLNLHNINRLRTHSKQIQVNFDPKNTILGVTSGSKWKYIQ